ncbi:MAG: hypothetical protein K0R31_1434 [Clostridiales bacterium]|jgi:hypothetical protein|nr:hypothetical protein [Clostridiales bacterium]
MRTNSTESLCALDNIRLSGGSGNLKEFFEAELQKSRGNTIDLINDEKLHFPSLFALQTIIRDHNLYKELNKRNKNALDIINALLKRDSRIIEGLPSVDEQMIHTTLKWILQTGYRADESNSEYEQIVDMASALLIKRYNDKTILPEIVSLIFERNRDGHFTYDLIWVFLEAGEPGSLELIANQLNSDHKKDAELARKILRFIPHIRLSPTTDSRLQYIWTKNWLQENLPFIYRTGESFHQSCDPLPFAVSLEAKYLCRKVFPNTGKTSVPLSDSDKMLLNSFNRLNQNLQETLSNYSFYLYRQNIYGWSCWLHAPMLEQIKSVRWLKGGFQ